MTLFWPAFIWFIRNCIRLKWSSDYSNIFRIIRSLLYYKDMVHIHLWYDDNVTKIVGLIGVELMGISLMGVGVISFGLMSVGLVDFRLMGIKLMPVGLMGVRLMGVGPLSVGLMGYNPFNLPITARTALVLRRGGSSRFPFPRFLTSKLCHASIVRPNYPYNSLKWPWEWFLTIYEIKIFFYQFSFSGNPRRHKKFYFRNSKFQKVLKGAILNIFWRNWS